ncbi:MAG TPA: response regulator, partial [Fimbriimonadaceae bacterium]|nr:response regulator [Fimbriimonadaceae bacterium]
ALTQSDDKKTLAEFFSGEERVHVENALARALISGRRTSDSYGSLSLEIDPVRSVGWVVRLSRETRSVESERRRKSVLAIVGALDAQRLDEHDAERSGLDLTVVGVGGVGLELALRRKPDFVLVGTHLPDGSASDFVEAMRSDPRLAGVPIAVVSTSGQNLEEARARRSGADRVVPGPIDSRALIDLVASRF